MKNELNAKDYAYLAGLVWDNIVKTGDIHGYDRDLYNILYAKAREVAKKGITIQ
jgi:hypothetical protein